MQLKDESFENIKNIEENLSTLKEYLISSFKESNKLRTIFDNNMKEMNYLWKESTNLIKSNETPMKSMFSPTKIQVTSIINNENKYFSNPGGFNRIKNISTNVISNINGSNSSNKAKYQQHLMGNNLNDNNFKKSNKKELLEKVIYDINSTGNEANDNSQISNENRYLQNQLNHTKINSINFNSEKKHSKNNYFSNKLVLNNTLNLTLTNRKLNEYRTKKINSFEDTIDNYKSYNYQLNDPLKTVETLIENYIQSGTATKKFDKVLINLNEKNSIELQFEGGLNANKRISSPAHKKLIMNKGDDFSVIEDD